MAAGALAGGAGDSGPQPREAVGQGPYDSNGGHLLARARSRQPTPVSQRSGVFAAFSTPDLCWAWLLARLHLLMIQERRRPRKAKTLGTCARVRHKTAVARWRRPSLPAWFGKAPADHAARFNGLVPARRPPASWWAGDPAQANRGRAFFRKDALAAGPARRQPGYFMTFLRKLPEDGFTTEVMTTNAEEVP